MTLQRTLFGWLAALALVAAACGGGGGEPALLAAADVPIVPEAAQDAPPADPAEEAVLEEGAEVEPTEEPFPEPAPEPEAGAEGAFAYAGEAEQAATMVVLAGDVADLFPDVHADAAHAGAFDGFTYYRRGVASPLVGDPDPFLGVTAGYEALLIASPDEQSRRRLGSVYPEVDAIETEVALYDDGAAAAARLASLRAAYEDLPFAEVHDQPGVAGEGWAAVVDDGIQRYVVVGLAGHGVVGTVTAYGATSPEPAVAVAQVLGVRIWKVASGQLAPRDPAAQATGYALPSHALENFAASGDVIVSDGDRVLERFRWSGTYEGPDRFSCQQTHYVDGTEQLVGEVIAAGGVASVFDLASLSSGEYELYSPEVAAATVRCPVFADAWKGYHLADPSVLEIDPASTAAGPGTSLRARDGWRLSWGLGLDLDDGTELDDFSIFVTDEGWATAIHAESSYPRETAEAFYGGDYGAVERVTVQESLKVTAADGVTVPEPLYFGGDATFSVGVGDEVMPPAAGAEAAAALAGASGGEAGAEPGAGSGAGAGDLQAAADDGLFGSGTSGDAGSSGDSGGVFSGSGPVGGAEDVATQDAVRLTMIGLLAYYFEYGDYRAAPADVEFYAVGASTTDDPAQAGSYATVYAPGDQETVAWGASGSGTYFCVAASANELVIYNSASSSSAVDTFDECAAGGSVDGW